MSNLEKASHVCVIVRSILLSGVLLSKFLSGHAGRSGNAGILVGTQLPALPGVRWRDSQKTLLLALSARCLHCVQSGPFYERLTGNLRNRKDIRIMALFPEGDPEAQTFLAHTGVKVPYLASVSFAAIGIEATPTILQVDSNGIVVREWRGELEPSEEKKVSASVVDSQWPF